MNEQILRKVLWADVYGSGASVVFTIIGAGLIGRWLGVSAWIPFGVGIILIPWVALLLQTVKREELRRVELAVVVVGNIGWAIAAAIVIWGFPDALSVGGKWILGLFSLAVLDYGILELVGLRKLSKTGSHAVG